MPGLIPPPTPLAVWTRRINRKIRHFRITLKKMCSRKPTLVVPGMANTGTQTSASALQTQSGLAYANANNSNNVLYSAAWDAPRFNSVRVDSLTQPLPRTAVQGTISPVGTTPSQDPKGKKPKNSPSTRGGKSGPMKATGGVSPVKTVTGSSSAKKSKFLPSMFMGKKDKSKESSKASTSDTKTPTAVKQSAVDAWHNGYGSNVGESSARDGSSSARSGSGHRRRHSIGGSVPATYTGMAATAVTSQYSSKPLSVTETSRHQSKYSSEPSLGNALLPKGRQPPPYAFPVEQSQATRPSQRQSKDVSQSVTPSSHRPSTPREGHAHGGRDSPRQRRKSKKQGHPTISQTPKPAATVSNAVSKREQPGTSVAAPRSGSRPSSVRRLQRSNSTSSICDVFNWDSGVSSSGNTGSGTLASSPRYSHLRQSLGNLSATSSGGSTSDSGRGVSDCGRQSSPLAKNNLTSNHSTSATTGQNTSGRPTGRRSTSSSPRSTPSPIAYDLGQPSGGRTSSRGRSGSFTSLADPTPPVKSSPAAAATSHYLPATTAATVFIPSSYSRYTYTGRGEGTKVSVGINTDGYESSSAPSNGIIGLRNLGNTCFMNSMLQCLSHTPEMTGIFLARNERAVKTDSILGAYTELMRSMWGDRRASPYTYTSYTPSLSPSTFKSRFSKEFPRFSGYSQNDAQEFMRFLVSALHDELKEELRKGKRPTRMPRPPTPDGMSVAARGQRDLEWYRGLENSPVATLFVGQLKSSLYCTRCKHTSITFDPFWDLALPMPKSVHHQYSSPHSGGVVELKSCFKHFTQEESLDGDESPMCGRCRRACPSKKKMEIHNFPPILVLHLKRFSGWTYRTKLDTPVNIPQQLNLSAYVSKETADKQQCRYELYAISNHIGGVFAGHYTAWVKHHRSREWYTFNDSSVSKHGSHETTSKPSFQSREAYILFYRQIKA